ncbi:MAG: TRAP transporter small permease [Clostridia bacterium]|nr:TRAP transporter small permease [Clostridia bacterium]
MKKLMSGINRGYDAFNKVNEVLVIVLMIAMCVDIMAQVIARFIFRSPFTWSEELSRYLFVWIALFGAAWCGRKHIHVRMTAVISRFPEPVLRVQQIAIAVICAACCFYLFPSAIRIFNGQKRLTAVTLGVTLGVEYIAAPCGILMMAIQNTVDALYALLDWEGYKARYLPKDA